MEEENPRPLTAEERREHYVQTMVGDCRCSEQEARKTLELCEGDVDVAMNHIFLERKEKAPGYLEGLVCGQCGCAPAEAHNALVRTNGDVITACMNVALKIRETM
jgi:NACalpha-BTF3-like transcription factor